MSRRLTEHRKLASELSGGTSSDCIKSMVLSIVQHHQLSGALLDFGAGKGELLSQLRREMQWKDLAGCDLMTRPTELPEDMDWQQQDLNENVQFARLFDVVICSEIIEHLENPRLTFRCLFQLLKPGGALVLTMPNQECIRSYAGLIFGGHFTHFLGNSYPAHITALLRMDLIRICSETGFSSPQFYFTNQGAIPKLTSLSWQTISFGLLRGRLFSDNLGMLALKPLN